LLLTQKGLRGDTNSVLLGASTYIISCVKIKEN